MSSDALISLHQLDGVMRSRDHLFWQHQLRFLLEREPALKVVVAGHCCLAKQYLKSQGLNDEQLDVVETHIMTMAAVSLSLLEGAHRRLWEGMLPDLTTEPKEKP